jgi:hypothetical protein
MYIFNDTIFFHHNKDAPRSYEDILENSKPHPRVENSKHI